MAQLRYDYNLSLTSSTVQVELFETLASLASTCPLAALNSAASVPQA